MSDPNMIDGDKMRFTGIDGEKRRAIRLTVKHLRHWAPFFAINCSISKPFFAVNPCSASFSPSIPVMRLFSQSLFASAPFFVCTDVMYFLQYRNFVKKLS